MWIWVLPTGRRRPSVRVGIPWFVAFVAWLAFARGAVSYPVLRSRGLLAWLAWLVLGAVVLPTLVATASLLLDVRLGVRALLKTAGLTVFVTALVLVLLSPDFAAFAFVGGFAVAAAAAASYALATSGGLEAWRDGNAP